MKVAAWMRPGRAAEISSGFAREISLECRAGCATESYGNSQKGVEA